jgi:CDP-diacylglycerol--glycerol-3-phosphate 3-phosphatidyltransferase
MVISLIAVHGHPVWLTALIYVTVAVTVLSGADYFFGLRRSLNAAPAREPRPPAAQGS